MTASDEMYFLLHARNFYSFPQMPLPFSITPECINKRKCPLSSEYYSDTIAPRGDFSSHRQPRCKEFVNVTASCESW